MNTIEGSDLVRVGTVLVAGTVLYVLAKLFNGRGHVVKIKSLVLIEDGRGTKLRSLVTTHVSDGRTCVLDAKSMLIKELNLASNEVIRLFNNKGEGKKLGGFV